MEKTAIRGSDGPIPPGCGHGDIDAQPAQLSGGIAHLTGAVMTRRSAGECIQECQKNAHDRVSSMISLLTYFTNSRAKWRDKKNPQLAIC
jgi:hypothetical protein